MNQKALVDWSVSTKSDVSLTTLEAQRRNLRDGSAISVTQIDLRDQLGPTSSRTKSSVTEG